MTARTVPAAPAVRRAAVLRRCGCGAKAGGAGECAACRASRLRRRPSAAGPASAPRVVHDVLRGSGAPLDGETRAHMEPRFGHSFAHVRVHADGRAAESAAAVGAHAYAVGRDLVFGAGRYAPGSASGRRLIAHELAHVVQQAGSADAALQPTLSIGPVDAPEEREARAAAERVAAPAATPGVPAPGGGVTRRAAVPRLMRDAEYPTAPQQAAVQEEVNPQHTAAGGAAVDPVVDAPGFRSQMRTRMDSYINQVLPLAQARQGSGIALSFPALAPLADVAQHNAEAFYGTQLRAARHTPAETARRAGRNLRDELHPVSDFAPHADSGGCQWLSDRMEQQGAGLMGSHNVLASSRIAKASCPPTGCPTPAASAPDPEGGRDQALFEQARNEIFCARQADLGTILLFQASFERPGEVFMQTHLAAQAGLSTQQAERRGRWDALGTLIHEMLHDVAHENFRDMPPVENSGLATEGFAEYFTRPVFDDLRTRAAGDDALRASIEGVAAPWDASLARERHGSYDARVRGVERIRDALGGNEQNLRAAFFLGQLEYIGLGGWNAAEARRREAARQPHSFGVAGLIFPAAGGGATTGGVRLDYGHVVLGQGGNLQLTLGAGIQYLSEGSVFELGPTAAVRYRWPHLFVEGRVGVMAGGGMADSLERTYRLDVTPEISAGVQLGMVRLSAGPVLMIPLAGGPVADRTVRLGGMVGLSFDFGRPTPAPARREAE
jgi:hypothetical protein